MDDDSTPLTAADFKRMKKTPRAKIIRRALGLSQEEFALKFHIPIGTLRDWEQGRKEPDAAAKAYLVVIGKTQWRWRRLWSPQLNPLAISVLNLSIWHFRNIKINRNAAFLRNLHIIICTLRSARQPQHRITML